MSPLIIFAIVFLGFLGVVGAITFLVINAQGQRRVLGRLAVPARTNAEEIEAAPAVVAPALQRWLLIPVIIGIFAFTVAFLAGLHWFFAFIVGVIVYLLASQIEQIIAERREFRIETQLADAIDLMVSSLNSGASVIRAIEFAAQESRRPLREQLDQLVRRIRLGDEPSEVFRDFMIQIPLETFRLFATTLAVHWEVGGSLGPTLTTVANAIRDRIEVQRRAIAMTAQSRLTVLVVILATYFVALIMWRGQPEAASGMVHSQLGAILIALAIFLQALGIAWSGWISKPRF